MERTNFERIWASMALIDCAKRTLHISKTGNVTNDQLNLIVRNSIELIEAAIKDLKAI